MSSMKNQIGENFKQLPMSAHLTQQQVENTMHISKVNYTRYETNAVNPDLDTLIALADFFDVTLDSLFNRD